MGEPSEGLVVRRLGRLRIDRPRGEPCQCQNHLAKTTFHNSTINHKLLNRQNQDDTHALLRFSKTLTGKFAIGQ